MSVTFGLASRLTDLREPAVLGLVGVVVGVVAGDAGRGFGVFGDAGFVALEPRDPFGPFLFYGLFRFAAVDSSGENHVQDLRVQVGECEQPGEDAAAGEGGYFFEVDGEGLAGVPFPEGGDEGGEVEDGYGQEEVPAGDAGESFGL